MGQLLTVIYFPYYGVLKALLGDHPSYM